MYKAIPFDIRFFAIPLVHSGGTCWYVRVDVDKPSVDVLGSE